MSKRMLLFTVCVVAVMLGGAAVYWLVRKNKTPETGAIESITSDEKTYVPQNGKIVTDGDIEPIAKNPSDYPNLTVWHVTSSRDEDATSEYCLLYNNEDKQIYSKWTKSYFGQDFTGLSTTYYSNATISRKDVAGIMRDYCWK